jgi:hypothetical protein
MFSFSQVYLEQPQLVLGTSAAQPFTAQRTCRSAQQPAHPQSVGIVMQYTQQAPAPGSAPLSTVHPFVDRSTGQLTPYGRQISDAIFERFDARRSSGLNRAEWNQLLRAVGQRVLSGVEWKTYKLNSMMTLNANRHPTKEVLVKPLAQHALCRPAFCQKLLTPLGYPLSLPAIGGFQPPARGRGWRGVKGVRGQAFPSVWWPWSCISSAWSWWARESPARPGR